MFLMCRREAERFAAGPVVPSAERDLAAKRSRPADGTYSPKHQPIRDRKNRDLGQQMAEPRSVEQAASLVEPGPNSARRGRGQGKHRRPGPSEVGRYQNHMMRHEAEARYADRGPRRNQLPHAAEYKPPPIILLQQRMEEDIEQPNGKQSRAV